MRWWWIALGVCALGCEGRPRRGLPPEGETASSRQEPHLCEIDLRAGAPEQPRGTLFSAAAGRSFADLVVQLRQLAREPNAKGVLVRLGAADLGMARAEEVARLLGALRSSGPAADGSAQADRKLPIVCHADSLGNATMLAVAGCSEVWLSPAGTVDTVGVAAQLVFAHALFDKLGVEVDFMQQGRFKGAEEPFTRDSPSDDAKASLQDALSGVRKAWLSGVEQGRGKPAAQLAIEDGPHTAEEAKTLGLVDRIGYEAEARQRAQDLAEVNKRLVYFGGEHEEPMSLGGILRALSGAPAIGVPHVAIVHATGAIAMAGGSPLGGEGISRRDLGDLLRQLARDPLTKAVVLRIDSPGGSALASDLLWRDVMDLRKQKPVVASVGGMAASGGYYLASAASKIVADQSSIVGSIGVVMGKLAVEGGLASIGVHVAVVPAKEGTGARAAWSSALASWDEPTRAKLADSMQATYRLFIARVAEGRAMSQDAVEAAAEGRIMAGTEGRGLGLVDEVGGLSHAIDVAIQLGKLDPTTPVYVEHGAGLFELLGADPAAREQAARQLQAQAAEQAVAGIAPWPAALGQPELSRWTAVLIPLTHGEHALAVLPFALSIR